MSEIRCSERGFRPSSGKTRERKVHSCLDSQGRCLAKVSGSKWKVNPLHRVGREKGIWTERKEYISKGIVLEKCLCVWEIAQTLA